MKKILTAFILLLSFYTNAQVYSSKEPLVHTFSIVARDEKTGEMAVGVQSHWFAVGISVPWAEAGVGAVATQSFVDKSYGPKALALLKKGLTPQQALDQLTKADAGRDVRQVAIIDSKGNVAAHTGKNCIQFAKHIKGYNFSVQSNMMLGDQVCEYMANSFKQTAGKPLAERVLLALEAAQKAGGDIRGMQAAAIVVVPGKKMELWNNKSVDLRVDDSPKPLEELRRLYNVHLAYEHMNNGDLAVEKNNMALAMNEYNAAMKLFPSNLEMQYWTAIILANNKQVAKAVPMLQSIFAKDKNWKELTRRLPPVGLLTVTSDELKKILAL
ncbi:MAG: Zn-dependent protease [Sediminibacterium sp.]|nr:Zn-dependent protease [Sediminibacterium sp.]